MVLHYYIKVGLSMVLGLFFVGCSSDSSSYINGDTQIVSKVKKTGQNISYTSYDDGYYEIGTTPNYTRVSDTVTDEFTKLMWQDDAVGSQMDWTSAVSYCSALTLSGYTDWRLPTRQELQGIADYGKTNPAISTTFLNTNTSYYYWTSTDHVASSDAWCVGFGSGDQTNFFKSNGLYVRCVRAGQ